MSPVLVLVVGLLLVAGWSRLAGWALVLWWLTHTPGALDDVRHILGVIGGAV